MFASLKTESKESNVTLHVCPPSLSGKLDLDTDTAEMRFDSITSRIWLALIEADNSGVRRGISTHRSLNFEAAVFLQGRCSQNVLIIWTGRGGPMLPSPSSTCPTKIRLLDMATLHPNRSPGKIFDGTSC